ERPRAVRAVRAGRRPRLRPRGPMAARRVRGPRALGRDRALADRRDRADPHVLLRLPRERADAGRAPVVAPGPAGRGRPRGARPAPGQSRTTRPRTERLSTREPVVVASTVSRA